MSENIYIHYGSDKFEKELFMSIVNRNMINKPFGGLWASDIKADQPWEKWCIDNDFRIDKLDKTLDLHWMIRQILLNGQRKPI